MAVVHAVGITENVVLPAWARDAEGNSVESSDRTEGSTLILDVVLTGAEVFPVVQGKCLGLRAPIAAPFAIQTVIHDTGNCF